MMTMSKALSAGQAKDYYQQEFTSANENYYSESGEVRGRWSGRLAEEWGLDGEVQSDQYERLVVGQDPKTGEQLVRTVKSRETVNNYGEEITTSEHRAGWDATFSAPKSVSLAGLVGGDERIRVAHRESVDEALKALEEYTQARGGGNKPSITTGKMIAAQFEHTAARPDHATGYAAPQLHTHVVIFNMTETQEGKTRSVQPLELYRSQQYATAIYRTHLAEKLQTLGYEIQVDPRTGAPEIKGLSKEYLRDSSPRRDEVLKEAKDMKERLEREGATVKDATVKEGAGLNQAAARTDRASKKYDHAEMKRRALEMDARYENQARRSVERALERGPIHLSQEEIEKRAREAVTFARDNAVEREAVADMRKVTVDALRRNLGLTTHEGVTRELRQRQDRGEFVAIKREQCPQETTTKRMLEIEWSNIERVIEGHGQASPIVEHARGIVDATATRRQIRLNESQRAAVERILSSRDQVLGLQGGAGTGKTTALSVLREVSELEGYSVLGFAPTSRAAKLLAESGIQTETLQKFISKRLESPENDPRLFVLDESSLASTKNLHKFFARLQAHDRVLLVGDVRQHQAVEAGSPFEQFQNHGMQTAKLTEIVRQRDPELKRAVEKLSARQIREAIESLESRGKVIEVSDKNERLQAIAKAYCESPENTLVISPANRERIEINSLIHQRLQLEGRISSDDHQLTIYVNRQDMTGTERTFANSYVPDEDIIRYNRASKVYGVSVGDYAHVIETNHERNEITVRLEDDRELTYNPSRLSGVGVYKETDRELSEGDRIQFRAPFTEKRVANGELGTITKIEDEEMAISLDGGREVSFEAEKFRHIDYGYAVTSYSSQGQTVDRVLVNADAHESELLLNQRMGYVALSRAREDAIIFTNSIEELKGALDRSVDKEMALEAVAHVEDNFRELREEKDRGELLSHKAAESDNVLERAAEGLGVEVAEGEEIGIALLA
jgi:conjugative relaxase-like TrwC/TraI family protein